MLGAVLSYGAHRRAAAGGLARGARRASRSACVSRFGAPRRGAEERRLPAASRSTPASPSASTSRSSPRAACSPTPRRASSSPASAPGAAPRLRPDRVGRPGRHLRAGAPRRRRRRRLRALHAPRPGGAAAAEGRPRRRWCGACDSDDDPVRELDDAQRVAVLNTIFHPRTPRLAVDLAAEGASRSASTPSARSPTAARCASATPRRPCTRSPARASTSACATPSSWCARSRAQRDVDAVLRRLEWQRAPDRWAMIAATDFLARSFTWTLPGAGAARGLGIAALQALGPVKSAIARQMMFGSR